MQNIDTKIEELEQLRKVYKTAQDLLPKHLWSEDLYISKGIVRKDKVRVSVKCDTVEQAAKWLELQTTEKQNQIGSAGSLEKLVESPYRMDLLNPCQIGRFSRFEMQISFVHEGLYIDIKFPTAQIENECLRGGMRKLSDSEWHYFTGIGAHKLREMSVNCKNFNSTKTINWYGGNRSLLDEAEIDKVIKHITSKNNL